MADLRKVRDPLRTFNRDRLAADHLPLAERRAQRLTYAGGLPYDEALSAALVGLAEAIDGYRPEVGEFAPFAGRVIDAQIRTAARAWRWRRRAEQLPGRELAGGDSEALLALVPDRLTTAELAEQRTDITRALAGLEDTERRVILLHGKLGHTFPSVAAMLELNEDHCKYLWRRAIAKMRDSLGVGLAGAQAG